MYKQKYFFPSKLLLNFCIFFRCYLRIQQNVSNKFHLYIFVSYCIQLKKNYK